jgi:hypothetical protein
MALYTRRLNTLVVEDETLQKLLHERRLLPYFTLYANRHRALHENYLDEHGFVKFKVPSRLSSSSSLSSPGSQRCSGTQKTGSTCQTTTGRLLRAHISAASSP